MATRILICPHCGRAALIYHGPQHRPQGEPSPMFVTHFDGKKAAPYKGKCHCQACGLAIENWDNARWVMPRDIGFCGNIDDDPLRTKFNVLLRAASRLMNLVASVASDERVPDVHRSKARTIASLIGGLELWVEAGDEERKGACAT